MKVIIKQTFHDKDCYAVIYKEGEEHEFESARAQHLVSLNLVELAEKVEKPEEVAETPKEETTETQAEAPKEEVVETPKDAEAEEVAETPTKRGRKPKAE